MGGSEIRYHSSYFESDRFAKCISDLDLFRSTPKTNLCAWRSVSTSLTWGIGAYRRSVPGSPYTEFCTVSVYEASKNIYIFWSVTPCSLAGIYLCFRRSFFLDLLPRRWWQKVCLKLRSICTKLHGVTLQRAVIFTVNVARTSSATQWLSFFSVS
jgi:hypothetical protein